jgi:hypothetical protein
MISGKAESPVVLLFLVTSKVPIFRSSETLGEQPNMRIQLKIYVAGVSYGIMKAKVSLLQLLLGAILWGAAAFSVV